MSNHFHILLEVPPMPTGGVAHEVWLQRLAATSTEAGAASVAQEWAAAETSQETTLGWLKFTLATITGCTA